MNVARKRVVGRLNDGYATFPFWSSAARATIGAPGLIDAPALTGELVAVREEPPDRLRPRRLHQVGRPEAQAARRSC